MTRLHRTAFSSACLIFFAAAVHPALAARVGPGPVLAQLAEGFGVIAAEVVRANAATVRGRFVDSYDVTFSVKEVFAQPIAGDAFPLKPGDTIELRLSAGYAAQLEWDVPKMLEARQKFILTVKRGVGGRHEHVNGASAPVAVKDFTDENRARFARLRELALVPADARVAALIKVVAISSENEALRSDALAGLSDRSTLRETRGREDALLGMLKIWSDPACRLSPSLLNQLDYAIRATGGSAFEDSDDRARMWVKRLLDPTPENRSDNNDRDNIVHGVLHDLLIRKPNVVSPAIVSMLRDKGWPEGFRRAAAAGMLWAYIRSEKTDSAWEPALQHHYTRVFLSKQDWPIRLAAADLIAASDYPQRKRRFDPDIAVRDAMHQALADMKVATVAEPKSDAMNAVHDLERAIKSIAPTTAPSGDDAHLRPAGTPPAVR